MEVIKCYDHDLKLEKTIILIKLVSVDCKLTHWSPWSSCHATCGNAVQHRTRRIQIHPSGLHGKPCTRLVEFRKCSMFPCIAE